MINLFDFRIESWLDQGLVKRVVAKAAAVTRVGVAGLAIVSAAASASVIPVVEPVMSQQVWAKASRQSGEVDVAEISAIQSKLTAAAAKFKNFESASIDSAALARAENVLAMSRKVPVSIEDWASKIVIR